MSSKRVVSFLPSATEILYLLEQEAGSLHGGIGRSSHEAYNGILVGRSHECDYPTQLSHLPVLTMSRLSHTTDSLNIHKQVQQSLKTHSSLYEIAETKLQALRPDIILTQNLCDVCSVDLDSVERVILRMSPRPRVLNLEPSSLAGVWQSISKVGAAVGLEGEAERVRARLEARMHAALSVVEQHQRRPGARARSVELLEWLCPLFPAGHWSAEMLVLSGGNMTLNLPNDISRQIPAQRLIDADPEVLIVAPCGFSLDTTRDEMRRFMADPDNAWIHDLQAAKLGQIYLVDGNQHFNRPGPRLVDAMEFLVGILYDPTLIPAGFPYERHVLHKAGAPPAALPAVEETLATPRSTPPMVAQDALTLPLTLTPTLTGAVDIELCHQAACSVGSQMYRDPVTGMWVMTEHGLRKRGTCCGNGCRHCPYGHFNVAENAGNRKRTAKITAVTLCKVPAPFSADDGEGHGENEGDWEDLPSLVSHHVLFWSGGADSYLALVCLLESLPAARVTLLTSFDADSGTAYQNVHIKDIMDQARHLGLDLLAVPLPKQASNAVYLAAVQEALSLADVSLVAPYALRDMAAPTIDTVLVFADVHLEDCRAWREGSHTCSEKRQRCVFPVFGQPCSQLQAKLEAYRRQDPHASPAPQCPIPIPRLAHRGVRVSAVNEQCRGVIVVGEEMRHPHFFAKLTGAGLDCMGEDGGFHTQVDF